MLEIFLEHKVIFLSLASVVSINFICLVFLILKERKADEEEIEEIVNSLADAKPRENKKIETVEEKTPIQIKQVDENKSDISLVLEQMKSDLEAKPEEVVANFEQEQEEKSIISYQELISSIKSDKKSNTEKIEIDNVEDTIEKPIMQEFVEVPIIDCDEMEEKPIIESKQTEEAIKKFKTTEFISPIYGKQQGNLDYPTIARHESKKKEDFDNLINEIDDYNSNISLEETLNLEPLTEEIKKNDEFLNALKEFRKNLQ